MKMSLSIVNIYNDYVQYRFKSVYYKNNNTYIQLI